MQLPHHSRNQYWLVFGATCPITSEHCLAVDLCQMTLASLLWLTSDHHTCMQG